MPTIPLSSWRLNMNRHGIWIITGVFVLGALIFGLSHTWAQRDFRTSPRSGDAPFVRYQVVNVNESEVIIMDVTTGDLYSAKAKDVKPYASRPRPTGANTGFGTDKDKKADFPRKDDKFDFKEKDRG